MKSVTVLRTARQAPCPTTTSKPYFGVLLRQWRAVRGRSQLTLALDAAISTRHLSCIETGRAKPSREMVLRLSEALEIPLRERNTLLLAAGYAPLYRQTSLDAPEMEAARQAVDLFLRQQEPYPAIVIDRYWNILQMNFGSEHFLARFPISDSLKPYNSVRLVFHPEGLRPFIENWEDIASFIIQRVHHAVAANPSDETMKSLLEEVLNYPDIPSRWRVLDLDDSPPPFLTINYRWKTSTLRMLSTLTSFGTAQDIALQETHIEIFFPADEFTRASLQP
jgi:transcriptional regulator with XRE-family HTH domain